MKGLLGLLVAAGLSLAQAPITLQYWHISTEAFGLPASSKRECGG
ncbi:hypothetical protein [Thermus sp.]|nr:hypothetical protein [Thermus sp.]MCS6869302.1 hypothetical protein [Thermus sp.]